MKEFIGMVGHGIKSFVAGIVEKSSMIIIALLVIQIGLSILNIRIDLEAYVHNINKTESRYQSTITALEYLHGKEIDRYAGEENKKLSADQQVQRKKSHKKYLYHYIKDWYGKSEN